MFLKARSKVVIPIVSADADDAVPTMAGFSNLEDEVDTVRR